jgi:hypothetical protein
MTTTSFSVIPKSAQNSVKNVPPILKSNIN